jgi:hypothetical protein
MRDKRGREHSYITRQQNIGGQATVGDRESASMKANRRGAENRLTPTDGHGRRQSDHTQRSDYWTASATDTRGSQQGRLSPQEGPGRATIGRRW